MLTNGVSSLSPDMVQVIRCIYRNVDPQYSLYLEFSTSLLTTAWHIYLIVTTKRRLAPGCATFLQSTDHGQAASCLGNWR